ncbi:FAD-dependent monooxygenase [Ferrovum sp.]|jgi:2-octaprenyl-6-methoxyphenol hydroxylase|uniref:FAD-dependent monooxygenase n=1 Tax=Ferrovum sp. TaxID=2609467 RepID=UPI002617684C|nr:FAD-dependent monooxygenase [Ferrovum sp.]
MDGADPAAVIIVGGGPVGAATALGLARRGVPVRLLEARPSLRADDRRTLALAQGSRQLLDELGAWPTAEVTTIDQIHISQRHRFGQTVLTARESGMPALGYILRYNTLMACLDEQVRRTEGLSLETGAEVSAVFPGSGEAEVVWQAQGREWRARTPLAVLADGGRALTAQVFGAAREQPYTQVALVAQLETDRPVGSLAYERFTPEGPIALLPLGQRYTLVWTGTQAQTELRLGWPEERFLSELQAAFGGRAGNFLQVHGRSWFPLTLKVLDCVIRPHGVAIGNAAQTMHPVAGQGLNMGLRDADQLIRLVGEGGLDVLGSAAQLERFVALRQRDRNWGIGFTHSLVRLFSNDWPILAQGRGLGLAVLNGLPGMRRALTRVMSFGFQGGMRG